MDKFDELPSEMVSELPKIEEVSMAPLCTDFDEDCPGVANKARCWLYDPQRGMCPYLRAGNE